jgi:hypothetical protein
MVGRSVVSNFGRKRSWETLGTVFDGITGETDRRFPTTIVTRNRLGTGVAVPRETMARPRLSK